MRLQLCGLVLVLFLAMPANADEPRNPDIEATIQGQITAFLADDFATAFTFASPTIRGIFGTPDNFGAMVKQGYPMVWRPSDVQMLELRKIAGNLWQRVRVTDAEGRSFLLDYQMIETPEGWQIDGVQLLPEAGIGV